jgi:antitoxin component YwqK of YwqJK toxin-antitoxin module
VTALLALLALAAGPVQCPPGAEARGAAPPEGFEAWCEARDLAGRARREGPARTWYDDGAPWVQESFHDGERDGPYVERHRNGAVAREGAYRRGRKHGTWTIRSESGASLEESTFRDGVPDGPFRAWWPGGALRTEGRHCGGAQCGLWRTFDESGREVGRVEYGEQRFVP